MVPVILLITLMIFTWAAAIYAGYTEPEKPSKAEGESQDDSYYDAA